jgi:hypothetical protein
MDDKVYLVYQWIENDDPDDETEINYLGVAMSEKRAKEILDGFNPGSIWEKTDDYDWRLSEKQSSGWTRWVETGVAYISLDIL